MQSGRISPYYFNIPQIWAARGLLGWSQEDLARESGVSISAIRNFESGKSVPIANNFRAIYSALGDGGVEFLYETDESGPGARVKKSGNADNQRS